MPKNLKRRRKILIAIAISLILFSAIFRFYFVPEFLNSLANSQQENNKAIEDEETENMTVMEGRIGLLKLVYDAIKKKNSNTSENESSSPFSNLTKESFSLIWIDVLITGKGVIEKETGEVLFEENETEKNKTKEKRQSFPLFGVEKKDYEIWSDSLNKTVVAKFVREEEFRGRIVYIYKVEINDDELNSFEKKEEDNFFNNLRYDELTYYYLSKKTSIPLNIDTKTNTSIIFPNFKQLFVEEGLYQTISNGTIWVENETIPEKYDEKEIIKKEFQKTNLSKDKKIGIYEEWTILYDKNGNELEEKYQDKKHYIFGVDRTSFKYVENYGNTNRSGYFIFPWGNLQKIDYEMWDDILNAKNPAKFIGETAWNNTSVYVYEQKQENVLLEDEPNEFIPTKYQVGYDYYYDGFFRWYVEKNSGFPIDLWTNMTVSVSPESAKYNPQGPLIKYPVFYADYFWDNTTVQMMKNISKLFNEVLLPLSSQKIPVFVIELHFSEEMINKMLQIDSLVMFILDLLKIYIPLIPFVIGIAMIGYVWYKIRREKVIK